MKILLVSNIFPPHVRGGYELGCLEIAEKYTELGHSVIVASSENKANFKKYPVPKHIDVRQIFSPVNYYDDTYNYHFQSNSIYFYEKIMAFAGYVEHNCIALRRLIEVESPHLVWIFNPLGLGPVGILDTVLSCEIKVIIHLMEHIDAVINDYSRVVNLTAKWKYLKSQVTAVSCSKKICKSNNSFAKYFDNRVIYNWIKIDDGFDGDCANKARHVLESAYQANAENKQIFKIVYFGQISEIKGVGFLYKVAKMIAKSSYKDKIIIDLYGKGEEVFIEWLKKNISKDKQLPQIFALKGFLSKKQLLKKLPGYDLAVFLLSDDEPFAYAPLEAMLKQVPVLITENSGNSEILNDEYNAIFIKDRKDVNEIYQKIIWCLSNPDSLGKVRENATKTLKQHCDLDKVTVPALNEVIEKSLVNKGYSFEYVLSICQILKYPYFELGVNTHLTGARYKFIDTVVDSLYRLPKVGIYLEKQVKNFIQSYRSSR